MELITVKLLVMILSGIVRIFFGMFPLVVFKTVVKKKWSKATDERMKKVISVLMFFGGGVLLATCFLHMMPEVRSSFAKAKPEMELPFSEIIFLAGFFLVYMIEDIVHSIVHKRMHNKEVKDVNKSVEQQHQPTEHKHKRNLALSCGTLTNEDKGLHNDDEVASSGGGGGDGNTCAIPITNNISIVNANGIPSAKTRLSLSSSAVENEHRINPNPLRETKEIFRKNSLDDEIPGLPKSRFQNGMGGITNGAFISEKFQYCDPDWWKDIVNTNSEINLLTGSNCTVASCTDLHGNKTTLNINHHHPKDSLHSKENNNDISQIPTQQQHHHSPQQNGHSHMHLPMDGVDQSIGGEIRNILIVVAISFHGIFEGMAIGLQNTEIDVWYLFLAVSLHECTILFCIGVELISSKTKIFKMIMYISVVAIVSPIGIAIGIIVTEKTYGGAIHEALVIGCFQGLAAGTLLYVTFFEIFQEEGRKLHRKCYHILVAVLGFVLMGSLEFLGGHDHGHSHGNPQNHTIIDDHNDHNHTHDDGHNTTSHNHDHDHLH